MAATTQVRLLVRSFRRCHAPGQIRKMHPCRLGLDLAPAIGIKHRASPAAANTARLAKIQHECLAVPGSTPGLEMSWLVAGARKVTKASPIIHSLQTRHYSPHWGLNPGPSVYRTDALPLSYRGCCGGGNCQSSCQLTAMQLNQEPSWDSLYLINQRTLIPEASAKPATSSLGERRLIFFWKKSSCQKGLLEQGAWPRDMLRTNDEAGVQDGPPRFEDLAKEIGGSPMLYAQHIKNSAEHC